MTEHLLEALGIYGGTAAIAFIAGLFPIVSVELFLIGLAALRGLTAGEIAILSVLAASGHQVAKTMCYFAGAGVLEHGKIARQVERARPRIQRWNKAPHVVLFLAATIGLPPMYLIAFIAHPLMNIRFARFTVLTFVGRVGRYAVLAVIPLIAG